MRILLTNDDGINAEGILALYKTLKPLGDVTIVAPDSERSSVGHGITLSYPIWYKKVYKNNKLFGYGISGTPADCVKFGVDVLMKKQKPDIVISGINWGCNDGCSVFYSGTVAGAREGALMGIPAIAISLDTFLAYDFSYAAQCGAHLVKIFKKQSMPKGTFLNVNVPAINTKKIKGYQITKQGTTPIHGLFEKRVDPHLRDYFWMSGKTPERKNDNSFDTYALNNGYITVTPIHCDSTDHQFCEKMKNWKI
ncbi:MAG: 5'/3'-nucleotidase SurE [Candidatus Omnitrophica bacterium]|nr:5'/3'-nucleotidase SurE [Candidatus Omnitrophota bacterium]